ncbi:uncharacterized protein LOC114280660 [Camellia sinensis]|uniref:uncharacterized protein LOC114280660 n=1 Tax=Camellia sinensis TaxID=4442 RepID=UPI001035E1E0|nr:uncharacterized protein LOC114280660 [Camellia sinensis]
MEGIDVESKDEALKSQVAIRCARAAMLLSSLKCSPKRRLDSPNDLEHREREMKLKRDSEDLRRKLVRERVKNRKLRLCSVTELLLQMGILMSLWTLCLIIAFKFL